MNMNKHDDSKGSPARAVRACAGGKELITRRQLLMKAGSGAALLAGYSCLGLKPLVGQPKTPVRLPLNGTTLTQAFPQTPGPAYRAVLLEAARDPLAFLESRFVLTDDQRKQLEK